MKGLQHEIASDVDSDINYPKNYVDIIEILAKFESLEPVDKQCYSRGSQKDILSHCALSSHRNNLQCL